MKRTPPQNSKASTNKCPLCTRNESRNMTRCEQCQQRYHKTCVGMEDIGKSEWTCQCGKVMEGNAEVQGSKLMEVPAAQKDKTLVKIPTITLHAATETVSSVDGVTACKNFTAKDIGKDDDADEEKRTNKVHGIKSSSRCSSKNSSLRKQLQLERLEEERKMVLERRRQQEEEDRAYLEKKYAILEESELGDLDQSVSDVQERVQTWVADINHEPVLDDNSIDEIRVLSSEPILDRMMEPITGQHYQCQPQAVSKPPQNRYATSNVELQVGRAPEPPNNLSQEHQVDRAPNPPNSHHLASANIRNHPPNQSTTMIWPTIQPNSSLMPTQSNVFTSSQPQPVQTRVLTATQVSARHVISKELPSFSGNPEEWPLFISSYENSTRTCGFSDDENLIRLHKCLKGKALEAVRFKLLLPSAVNDVVNTLRLLYGRPEIIISTLIQRVRNEPGPKIEKLDTLIPFALSVQNLCATIEISGIAAHMQNPMLIQELVDKLPAQLKLSWALHAQMVAGGATLNTLGNWLFEIAQAANTVTSPFAQSSIGSEQKYKKTTEKGFVNTHNEGRRISSTKEGQIDRNCPVCDKAGHQAGDCPIFKEQSRSQRWETLTEKHLCRKCLGRHSHFKCSSRKKCGKDDCTYLHHPLLHNAEKGKPTSTLISSTKEPTTETAKSSNIHLEPLQSLLFRVVPITLYGKAKSIQTYAFLDEGSSLTLLEQSTATELELDGTPDRLCLKWTAETTREEPDSQRVSLQISSRRSQSRKYHMSDVRTVRSLNLPMQSVNVNELKTRYPYLLDTPLESYDKAVPKILIGIDNWKLGIPTDSKEGKWREPVATRTRLGWAVHGFYDNTGKIGQNNNINHIHHSYHTCDCSSDENLSALVKDFFSMDNFGVKIPETALESKHDKRARELLDATTVRVGNRYETGLLWKNDEIELPDSKPMALRRLMCLERKMSKEPQLANNLKQQINDYVTKGYARKLSTQELLTDHHRKWYLPIFTVVNPNKPAKVRLIWDAAAKVDGISLNSALLKGPDQLAPLINVLYCFRQRPIAICGDIKEMFHQVRIKEQDQHSQRFLWRDGNTKKAPDTYVMQVMTFGATCSPSSAQYVKNTNAHRYANEYPRAVESIIKHHYVDDLLDSVDSVKEAIDLVKDVTRIHQEGGFEIRNWLSNSSDVLATLTIPITTENKNLNISPELNTEKVLGMYWCTSTDTFTYSMKFSRLSNDILSGSRHPTKREVLRTLMSIFDPLGFLAFYLVYVKMLLQEIWRTGIDWDDKIGDEQLEKWKLWLSILPEVTNVRIPRCYTSKISSARPYKTELHVFVDASEHAFAAVAYLRAEQDGIVECALIGAKTKVAPQQLISIPRLELQAATLGTRLANSIITAHTIKIDRRVFWSDSKTVMCWIRSDHRRYRQFVAFRIGEILESSTEKEWRWIPTKMNVADEATKWQRTPSFEFNNRWFEGPKFLLQSEDEWPKEEKLEPAAESMVEVRTHMAHIAITTPLYGLAAAVDRRNNWHRLLRVQAYTSRYITNLKAKIKLCLPIVGPITHEEYSRAETWLIRQVQAEAFPEELATLSTGKYVEKSSVLYNCSPYIDSEGIIRMKGRIDCIADVEINTKRPIILPKHHNVTQLIVGSYHKRYHHRNHETVVNEVRQKYFIPNLRTLLKRIIRTCQRCKNATAVPNPPEMAQLPSSRLAAFKLPFTHVGVDYFGPILVKVGRRQEKRWGVLFTCLTVRAVHIEIASSLTTDSCIMCIRNFVARRGVPSVIYSDNGTNFKGADNELRAELAKIDQDRMHTTFTSPQTKWIFNPPGAPHMGGSWERLVGSIKKVAAAIMPTRTPSDELLRCVLMEAESVVNSRPLTYIPIENNTAEALTPNHFLIGNSNGEKPITQTTERDLIGRKDWRIAQQLADNFWRRWIREYLPTLTRRSKWHSKAKPIQVGDVVIVVDEKNSRNCWPKGIVTDTTATRDGQVRKATVQTAHGTYEKPAVKLAVLDVEPST